MPMLEASRTPQKLAVNGSIASLPFVKAHWGMYSIASKELVAIQARV